MFEKISSALRPLLSRKSLLPTIMLTGHGEEGYVHDALLQLGLDGRILRGTNMVSGILPTEIVKRFAEVDEVLKIFRDFPVAIPESVLADPRFILSNLRAAGNRVLRVGFEEMVRELMPKWNPTFKTRRYIGAHVAEEAGITGKGVKIAVVDSDSSLRLTNHPQLRGKVIRETIRGQIATDTNGHGGHVLTTAIGWKSRSPLGLDVEGVAKGAEGIGIKALFTPMGTGMTSDIIEGVFLARDMGAKVINLSLGSEEPVPIQEDAFCYAIDLLPDDVIVVAASGNSGPEAGTVNSPGTCPKAITVGALDTQDGSIADFSSRGPTVDGFVAPDFVMPGVEIYSGITQRTLMDRVGDLISEGYGPLSGTSMATPHMTGLLALAKELFDKDGIAFTYGTVFDIGEQMGLKKDNDRGYGPLTWEMIADYHRDVLGYA